MIFLRCMLLTIHLLEHARRGITYEIGSALERMPSCFPHDEHRYRNMCRPALFHLHRGKRSSDTLLCNLSFYQHDKPIVASPGRDYVVWY